ncbi:hypothetical protein QQF64_010621 [Cirrhinus molitorella]|uniref:Uncharacterized protein n=1 Tax=Cirrhinus molitorella TaxID=172907 RepID=A0ABR3LWW5_9TELE
MKECILSSCHVSPGCACLVNIHRGCDWVACGTCPSSCCLHNIRPLIPVSPFLRRLFLLLLVSIMLSVSSPHGRHMVLFTSVGFPFMFLERSGTHRVPFTLQHRKYNYSRRPEDVSCHGPRRNRLLFTRRHPTASIGRNS